MIKNSRDKIPFIQQGKMEENENRKGQLKASLSEWQANSITITLGRVEVNEKGLN